MASSLPQIVIGLLILIAVVVVGVNTWWQRKYARIVAGLFDNDAILKPRRERPDQTDDRWTVMTSDRTGLSVSLIRGESGDADAPVVIFCHEFGSDGWSAKFYCEGLLEAGFDVLTFDFSNHGESDYRDGYRPCFWLSEFEVMDVRAVVRFALAEETLRHRIVGVMGISRGAGAALIVAAETPSVRNVFVEAVYSTKRLSQFFVQRWMRLELSALEYRILPFWHILWTVRKGIALVEQRRGCRFVDLEGRLAALRSRRVTIVSGMRDSYVPLEVIGSVVRETGHSDEVLWRVPRAKHNQARDLDPEEFDRRAIETLSVGSTSLAKTA